MSSVPIDRPTLSVAPSRLRQLWPLAVGLAVLYVPTLVSLWSGPWSTEEEAHGPIVLAVVLWLFWRSRALLGEPPVGTRPWLGWGLLALGLLLYVLGRSQDVAVFEVGSLLVVLPALLLIWWGRPALRALRFPLFFLIFMVPLPQTLIDALTGSLKQQVSAVAEHVLYAAGYPIARDGVMLLIGQYQLLVADACSGLNSLFSLSALGLLYIYMMRHTSVARNVILAVCIPPIAIVVNIVRVIGLVLVTYYFGDEVGQGFLHGFSGMFLFVAGLLILFLVDAALGRLLPDRRAPGAT